MLSWKNKAIKKSTDSNPTFFIKEIISPAFIEVTDKTTKSKHKILDYFRKESLEKFTNFVKKTNQSLNFKNSGIAQNFFNNECNLLVHGNNIDSLEYLLRKNFEESVDLVYIDPPFMTNVNFFKNIELRTTDSSDSKNKVDNVIAKRKVFNDRWLLDGYLQFMYERLVLIRKLMKDSGSIYIHLDENCSHYIKIIMDEVFGREKFRREITWNTASLNVAGFKGQIRNNWIYGSGHILFYTKGDEYTFNTQFIPRTDEFKKKKYKNSDDGGKYRVTRRNNKIYLKDDKGEPMINIWNDILSFNYAKIASSESVFYSTQKPESLLERIIKTSSNPGDIVLDCFVGSGTTVAVAEKQGRRWIGCDINVDSIHAASKRIQRIYYRDHGNIIKNSNISIKPMNFLVYGSDSAVSEISEKYNSNSRDFFDFECKFDNNKIKIEISGPDKSLFLDFLRKSTKKGGSKSTINNKMISNESFENLSLIDSIFFDFYHEKDSLFQIYYADLPRKRKECVRGKYQFNFNNVGLRDSIIVKIKVVDILGREFYKLKKVKV